MDELCLHELDNCYEDHVTGDVVCTQCGLVTDRLLTSSNATWSPVAVETATAPAAAAAAASTVATVGNLCIADVCQLFQLGEAAVSTAELQAARLHKMLLLRRGEKRCKQHVSLYAVYHIMLQNQTSWSLTDFANRMNVLPKKLWELETVVRECGGLSDLEDETPQNHVDSWCYELGLGRRTAAGVRALLDGLTDSNGGGSGETTWVGKRPRNVAAAAIYSFCWDLHSGIKRRMFLHRICEVAQCSPNSVSRLVQPMNVWRRRQRDTAC
jgi:transcription initiation factor TFIIIB Brf1 subunit/transcription initiation factor TFIIB